MFRTKNIYFEMCKKSDGILHKLTSDERRGLQLHLCKMYKDLEQVCELHGLSVMLAFGSTLGAVRHKGFIPWDDDMDVFMPRADYDRFITDYADELSDNYIIYAPNSKNGTLARFAKLVDKNTRFIEPGNENIELYAGAFIDIFPLDSITDNKLMNKIKKVISMALIFTGESVRYYQLNSPVNRCIMSGSIQAYFNYLLRKAFGFLFSFMSYQRWFKILDNFCRNTTDTSYLDFVQSDYRWNPLPKDLFLPTVKGEFEGMEFNLPHRSIEYLEMEFGDWKRIPPANERPEHYVVDIQLT